jgi:enamine deaminase RidA (YjgF/YER057c/UK114 family)
VGQFRQVLLNILAIVETAGGRAEDITRLTWFITDKADYLAKQREVGLVYREVMGRHFPAMSVVVVADLLEDDALLEIEATAEIT